MFRDLLTDALALISVLLLVYAKCLQAKQAEEHKEHKADIETLFGGKK